MVKLILPNSAPPGQESQKCPENSATDLVTPRKTRAFVTSRQSKNFSVGHLAHGEKKFAACARWPSPWHYFWDIFGSPGQEGPSWAKWVSPLNSSMKTTTFKPNLYFYHRIPLTQVEKEFEHCKNTHEGSFFETPCTIVERGTVYYVLWVYI